MLTLSPWSACIPSSSHARTVSSVSRRPLSTPTRLQAAWLLSLCTKPLIQVDCSRSAFLSLCLCVYICAYAEAGASPLS